MFSNPLKPLRSSEWGSLLVLLSLEILVILLESTWLALDQGVPSWDPADHLIGSLNYWWMVQQAAWFSADWWQGLWLLSSKYPPLLYLSSAPFLSVLGRNADAAISVNLLYTAILLGSVYGLGRHLFNRGVGLWAAGLVLLLPQLYTLRSQYFMDYPLTALIACAFYLLTLWKDAKRPLYQWLLALMFGLVFGLAFLVKQTGLFFLLVPLISLGIYIVWQRTWSRLLQLVTAVGLFGLLIFPWSRTNWLFQISAAFSANTRSAEIEGDPDVLSIEGWVYYFKSLPQVVSYPILVVSLIGLIYGFSQAIRHLKAATRGNPSRLPLTLPLKNIGWLLLFWGGAYVVWSGFANKDLRYVMPYLSGLAVILAVGMASWPRRWQVVPWATVGLSVVLMLVNLFPIGGDRPPAIASILTPAAEHRPYTGQVWPHAEIVEELVQAQPYQIVNLGVVPSTPEINQHNLNYFGTLKDFQVYGRRMGKSQDHIEQDLRSLSWFVTVSRPQLDYHDRKSRQRQQDMTRTLRRSGNFERHRRWTLPDGSELDLFRRRELPVEVQPLGPRPEQASLQLEQVQVPERVPTEYPIPVTYSWVGPWDQMVNGVLLLTWQKQGESPSQQNQWLHDHAIGLGTLRPAPIQANQSVRAPAPPTSGQLFRVIERTAMVPPADAAPGTYTLKATYINSANGEATELEPPAIALNLDPEAAPVAAPEVDWVSQLRSLSKALPEGPEALEPVFDQVGRFSLYDPIQSYAVQAEKTLSYRLQRDPDNLDYAYGLTLAQVLQRNAEGAIATLNHLTQLDSENPYAHAYLAFVNLYALHPRAAQRSLQPGLEIAPESQELKALSAIASLLQGNLWRAWVDGRAAFS